MASEEQELANAIKSSMVEAGRKARSDKGLPRRRSLLLSRAASARFVRVAAALPGGEEELAGMLEPLVEQLFAGSLHERLQDDMGESAYRTVGNLEDIALAAVRAKMRGEASDA